MPPQRPQNRRDFKVAIICALQVEADAVISAFDRKWDIKGRYRYRKARHDHNSYTTGCMGEHNVVLAHMPRFGSRSAFKVAHGLKLSFEYVELTLVVGICGVVPGPDRALGDLFIGTKVADFEGSRLYTHGLERRESSNDYEMHLQEPLLHDLGKWRTRYHQEQLRDNLVTILDDIRTNKYYAEFPGPANDRLYLSSYLHKHRKSVDGEVCKDCSASTEAVCEEATKSTCEELNCDLNMTILRREVTKTGRHRPQIHFGEIGSVDWVIRSAQWRDNTAKKYRLVAFEMEGAGVLNVISNALIVKAACDYADSHKNKLWQQYAAQVAAAGAKAILDYWSPEERYIPSRSETWSSNMDSPALSYGDVHDGRKEEQISSLTEPALPLPSPPLTPEMAGREQPKCQVGEPQASGLEGAVACKIETTSSTGSQTAEGRASTIPTTTSVLTSVLMEDSNEECEEYANGNEQVPTAIETRTEFVSPKPYSINVHWGLRSTLDHNFVGRHAVIAQIERALSRSLEEPDNDSCWISVTGIAGQGKSEICNQVAQRMRHRFWGVFKADVSVGAMQEDLPAQLRCYYVAQTGSPAFRCLGPVLLILDCGFGSDIKSLASLKLDRQVHVLIASRDPEARNWATRGWHHLGGLHESEAETLLIGDLTGQLSQRGGSAAEVCSLLANHPAALLRARHHLVTTGSSFSTLCESYQAISHDTMGNFRSQTGNECDYTNAPAADESVPWCWSRETSDAASAHALLSLLTVMPIKALPVRWIELAAHYAKPPWASPEYHDDALRQWYYQETSPALQSSGPHTMDSTLWTAIRVLESQSLLLTSFPEPLRLHPIAKLWAWQYLDEQARTIWRLTFAVMMVLSRGTVEHPLIGLNERLCARYDTLFHWQGLRSTEGLTEATTLLQLLFHDTYLLSFEEIDSKTVERLRDAFQSAAPKPRMSTCPWYLAVLYVKALLDTGHIEDAVAVLDSIIRRDGLLTSSLMPIAESNTQSYLDRINSDHLSNDRIIEAMKCRAWGYLHAGWLGDAMIMLLGIRQMQSNQNAYDDLPRELRIIVRDKAVLPLQSLQYLNQGNHWSVMHLFADRGVGYLELLYAYQDVAVHASEDLGTITMAIKKALAFAHSRAAFWKERNSDRPVTHRDDQDVLKVQELCSHIVKVQSTTLPPGSLDRISWERNEVDVSYFNGSSERAAQLMADMIRVHGDRSADQALPESTIESWQDYLSEIQESQRRKSSDVARGEDEKLLRERAHGMPSEQAQDKVEDSSESSDDSEIVPPPKTLKSRRTRARSVQERRGVTPRGGVRRSLAGQSPPAHRRAQRAIREALVSDDSDDVASDLWSTRAQSGRHKVVTSGHRRRSRPRRPAGRPIRHETSVGNRAPSGFLEMMFGSMFSSSSGRSSTLR